MPCGGHQAIRVHKVLICYTRLSLRHTGLRLQVTGIGSGDGAMNNLVQWLC